MISLFILVLFESLATRSLEKIFTKLAYLEKIEIRALSAFNNTI